ncbi:MAG: hypothetical protein KC446_06435, partial [Flavobacteriales bacterium]|nr:hypothetical protein [Flavobacteriales bacterium]
MMILKSFKSILMILAFGLSFSVQAQCTYTLTLLDSYGDGWNGNSMYVQTSGYSPSTLTLSTGSSISYQISITTGDTLTFGWLGGGTYQDECTFTVTDNATGTTVYTSPAGNLMSTTSPQYTTVCTLTSNSTPCLYNTPYTESFSGTGGGWVAPTNQFNIGSINGCWDRGVYTTYNWIKAPSPSSSL